MAGLFLGWAVFPAFFVALVYKRYCFHLVVFHLRHKFMCHGVTSITRALRFSKLACFKSLSSALMVSGVGAGVIGVGGAILLASAVLAFDGGKNYADLIGLLIVSHLPIF
ncbi:cobalt transport protein CbiM [Actinobacillus equuli]|nr:cobalt transport protein CbiM [Actinobacillus equuli]